MAAGGQTIRLRDEGAEGLRPYSAEVPPVVDVSERLAVSSERFVSVRGPTTLPISRA